MNGIEQRYLRAIRSRVCRNCPDLMPDQACGLSDRICPIERNLHDILQIVSHIEHDWMQASLATLRRQICANCEHEDLLGRCLLRSVAGCALDRYFVVVIDAIEDVRDAIRVEAHALAGHEGP